jgi:hypothetical protein
VRTLEDAAYELAEEIRDGKWAHVECLKFKPVPACTEIIDELRKRRPGCTLEQYQRAIADGLFASR